MHVDVDGARIEFDEQRDERMAPLWNQVTISAAQRAEQQPVAYRAPIDEKELQAGIGPVKRRQANEPVEPHAVARAIERHGVSQKFAAHDAAEASEQAIRIGCACAEDAGRHARLSSAKIRSRDAPWRAA